MLVFAKYICTFYLVGKDIVVCPMLQVLVCLVG